MRLLKPATLAVVIGMVALTGCKEGESSSRADGAKTQESLMKRAQAKTPVPQVSNFLTRDAVAKWMRRMDTPDKTFYVYLMGNNGQQLGYYVAQTRPISNCTLMTPPDKLHYWSSGNSGKATAVTQAPSLDGVYSTGGCDSYFFFDAATDAFVEINGLNFYVSDQPLAIEAEPIRVDTGG